MSVERKPAIKRNQHPAEELPERPTKPVVTSPTVIPESEERLTEQHNVRIRPSTKQRLVRGVDKLRYETGDRSISIASITDTAIVEYLDRHGC